MSIRHHKDCSVTERGASGPSYVSAQGIEDREAWRSETPTAQYIICNIKNGAVSVKTRVIQRKTTLLKVTRCFLFPDPVLPKGPKEKPCTTYPKYLPSRLPHHQCADPGTDPLNRPYLRINSVNPTEDSCPGWISDCALTSSRTHISSPLVITREQRSWCARSPTRNVTRSSEDLVPDQEPDSTKRFEQAFPKTNVTTTRVCTMDQDYPLICPGPGSNPSIYPPFLTPARRGPPEGRIPKVIFFLNNPYGAYIDQHWHRHSSISSILVTY